MTTKRFSFYQDIINLIIVYMIVISTDMVIGSVMQIKMNALEFAADAVMILCCYICREHVKKLFWFIVIHAAMITACIFIPLDAAGWIRMMVTAVVFSLLDLHNWFSEDKSVTDVHPGLGALFLVAFLMSKGRFELGYSAYIYYMGMFFVILVLLRLIIKNFNDLSGTGQFTDDMPIGEIFRNNTVIAFGIILIAAGLMVFIRADGLILAINRFVCMVWMKLAAVISACIEKFLPDEALSENLADAARMMEMLATEDDGDSFLIWFIRILDAVVTVFATIIGRIVKGDESNKQRLQDLQS